MKQISYPAVELFFIAERWEQKFNMSVKRSGLDETNVLTQLPRNLEKVETYQFIQG